MGRGSSKPAPEPDPLLLHLPWREVYGTDKQSALQYVNNYRPQTQGQQLRILLHGPVGAGKSSFINSVNSVLRGRMCNVASVANISESSHTRKYKTYRIPKGDQGDTFYPFVLNDMMGLQQRDRRSRRIHVKDVKRLLKGHIRDEYTFNPDCKISKLDQYYRENPTINDKVHVVVFVIDANTESLMSDNVVETIQDVRDEASDLGIPQVVLLTKIDEACPEIKNDVNNVYKSIELRTKMKTFSALVGIPKNCMFAVKNYTDTSLDNDTDALILQTLRHIIDYGDGFLNKMVNDQEDV